MTDVVIAGAARTAIGSYGRGLKDVSPSDLGATASKAALERAGIEPGAVDHVVFGNVIHTEPRDMYMARVVGIKAGIPQETPAYTVNRLCGTGVQAIVSAAQAIQTGEARVALAGGAGLFWIFYNVWWNWTGLDIYDGLPLHICDLAGILAPLALATRARWARATLYFWTFAFTAQAFIQPTLTAGSAHPLFWMFWISHTLIVACALYDLIVLKFRPGWGDFVRAGALSAAYLAAIVPTDVWLGSNYGYVGNPPPYRPIPPFVAALGPWPERIVIIAGLAALACLLLLLPWLAHDPAKWKPVRRKDHAPL